MRLQEIIYQDPVAAAFYVLRVIGLLLVLLLVCQVAYGEPVAKVDKDGVAVTLFNEPCKLDIANLQYRAEWKEPGKTYEGCWGVQGGIVITFWADRTIGLIPGSAFRPLTGS